VLYYSFAAFLLPMQHGLGFSQTALTGTFSLSVILVRDTKDQGHGPIHRYTPEEWRAFVAGVRNGEFDLGESGRLL
jgi:hypothetical protein